MLEIRQLVEAVLLLVEGIWELIGSCHDGVEFEDRLRRLSLEVSARIYRWSLERLDDRLLQERDRQRFKVVGFRERMLVTTLGEVRFRRRLYRDCETQTSVFLLDRTLGFPSRKRISPSLERMSLDFATRMSFGDAADSIAHLFPSVSKMAVWKCLQESGDLACRLGELQRRSVYEDGEVPRGTRRSEVLYIEADGVSVRQRSFGGRRRRRELKLGVIYEGKEEISPGRRTLVGRQTVAGLLDCESFWERVGVRSGSTWDMAKVREVHIGGDGADWVKEGVSAFPGAEYHLDPFHLRRALTEGLRFSSESYLSVCSRVVNRDRTGVEHALQEAYKQARDHKERDAVKRLRRYVLGNWEGIVSLSDAALGSIEGQVRHTLARRMKNIGGFWSEAGMDHMAHLLAARMNGELHHFVAAPAWDRERLDEVLEDAAPIDVPKALRKSGQDTEAWLRVNMPALQGPHSSRPWVKYVLRDISRIKGLGA